MKLNDKIQNLTKDEYFKMIIDLSEYISNRKNPYIFYTTKLYNMNYQKVLNIKTLKYKSKLATNKLLINELQNIYLKKFLKYELN